MNSGLAWLHTCLALVLAVVVAVVASAGACRQGTKLLVPEYLSCYTSLCIAVAKGCILKAARQAEESC